MDEGKLPVWEVRLKVRVFSVKYLKTNVSSFFKKYTVPILVQPAFFFLTQHVF